MRGALAMIDAEAEARSAPHTFQIPSAAARNAVRRGDLVKVAWRGPGMGERPWYTITRVVSKGVYDGTLFGLTMLPLPENVRIRAKHIVDIDRLAPRAFGKRRSAKRLVQVIRRTR